MQWINIKEGIAQTTVTCTTISTVLVHIIISNKLSNILLVHSYMWHSLCKRCNTARLIYAIGLTILASAFCWVNPALNLCQNACSSVEVSSA